MSSESTPVDPQATRVPYGWTENEGYLLKKYYWADKNSIKTMLQDDYKIPNVKPLITRYVWNGIANIVCRIDGQKDLTSIEVLPAGSE